MLAGIATAVFATSLVDGGKLLEVLAGKVKLDETAARDRRGPARRCCSPRLLALPVDPGAVVRARRWSSSRTAARSRRWRSSLRAALANWRPIAVYGPLVFFFGGVLPGVVDRRSSPRSSRREFALVVVVALLLPYVFLFVRDAAHLRLRELPRRLPRRRDAGRTRVGSHRRLTGEGASARHEQRPSRARAAGIARWLPGLAQLRDYPRDALRGDLVAGLVGVRGDDPVGARLRRARRRRRRRRAVRGARRDGRLRAVRARARR